MLDPVLRDAAEVQDYQPGRWGPPSAERLAADIGGWHAPSPLGATPGKTPSTPAEPRPDPQLNSPAAAQHTHRNKEATQASDNPNESTIDDARIRAN